MATHADLPRPDSLTLGDNTAEERHRVALHAVLRADTVPERRELLDMIGLLPTRPARRRKRPAAPTTPVENCPINTREVNP